MMTMNKAKRLAMEKVAHLTGRSFDELLIVDELTQCRRFGWIFFYEARAYLETGDVGRAIGATGPVVVMHHGDVHMLGGDRPSQDVLHEFQANLQLRQRQR